MNKYKGFNDVEFRKRLREERQIEDEREEIMNNEYVEHQESCINCKYELTCGYSPLATLGRRTKNSFSKCCLGEKSYGRGKFFKQK